MKRIIVYSSVVIALSLVRVVLLRLGSTLPKIGYVSLSQACDSQNNLANAIIFTGWLFLFFSILYVTVRLCEKWVYTGLFISTDTTKSGEFFTKRLHPTGFTYPAGDTVTYSYGLDVFVDNYLNRPIMVQYNGTTVRIYAYEGLALTEAFRFDI